MYFLNLVPYLQFGNSETGFLVNMPAMTLQTTNYEIKLMLLG